MKAQLQHQRMQRDIATKLRSKFHAQTDSAAGRMQAAHSKERKKLFSMSRQLVSLRHDFSVSRSESSKKAAADLFSSMEGYKLEDDPLLRSSQVFLSVASSMHLDPQIPGIQYCLDMLIRHTYLLTPSSMYGLLSSIMILGVNNGNEILRVLVPRLLELVDNYAVHECVTILQVMQQYKYIDEALKTEVLKTLTLYLQAAEPDDVCRAALTVALMGSHRNFFAEVFSAIDPHIATLSAGGMVTFCRAIGKNGTAPRHLLNKLARAALAAKLSCHDAAEILHAYHLVGYRHVLLLRRLSMRQLTELNHHTPLTISLVLSALAHFRIREHDVFAILGSRAVELIDHMSAFSCSAILHSFAKVDFYDAIVCRALMKRFVSKVSSNSETAVCNVLWATGRLGLFRHEELEKDVVSLLDEVSKLGTRMNPVLREGVDSSIALFLDSEKCSSKIKELAARVKQH